MQLDDRAALDKFVADEPMNKAGVYQRVEIHRWSNSFQKRAADYARKGLQQFLCTGPKTGTPDFFREHLHAHESYFASYGDSFIFRDDRAALDKFVADEPMNKAGVYQRVEIHRWSNSFQKRAADYARKGLQQFLCTGPKTGTPDFFREHLHAHESYFASYGESFIFRGPIRSADGADNIGTALLIELPNRAAADRFRNEEPFARNGGYQRDVRITRWAFGD